MVTRGSTGSAGISALEVSKARCVSSADDVSGRLCGRGEYGRIIYKPHEAVELG